MNHPYTSTEFFHFVGSSDPTNDVANYKTLLKVLDASCVSYGPHFPTMFENKMSSPNWDEEHILAGGLIYPEVTCYADIPITALGIHMKKYGRFGISFKREWLVRNGARPVIYFPIQPSDYRSGWGTIYTRLNVVHMIAVWKGYEEHAVIPIRSGVWKQSLGQKPETQSDAIRAANAVLTSDFFRFLKVFNSDLDEDHPDNFYMEREWRIANPLPFKVSDVIRVIVPEHFEKRLANERPSFALKISHAPE